ncbi:glutamate receptor 1-like [Diaphorina citri]|uniref:Glutamate receptor 1-like n=1 Tax=Diaphorina citri TaxID=121845 RepID=A0A1S4ET22_DIACI|nr:glutamate receptor 1-like [Diaphorina citri]
MLTHNQNTTTRRFELQAYVDVINTADAFKLSRLICNQFSRGVFSMLGAVSPDSFDTFHSYSNTFQMPFITPWFPEKVLAPSSGFLDYAISMRPDYHQAIIDTVKYYGWKNIIYMYDSHDGLLRLQQIYQSLKPGSDSFQVVTVRRIQNVSEAIDFLHDLELLDRWGFKHIVLDCATDMAKAIVVSHVRKVTLGKRTYHYLLSGLAQSALMYDAVLVIVETFNKLLKRKPDLFKANVNRRGQMMNNGSRMDCNTSKGWVTPWEHGDKISKNLRKVEIEGLTGDIRFNNDSKRMNYTLHVVEMTVNSAMVKVEIEGLTGDIRFNNDSKRMNYTLHVVEMTVNSAMVKGNDKYEGFCKDLADLLAQRLKISSENQGIEPILLFAEGSDYVSDQVYRAYLEEMICGSILDGSVQHIALVRQILDGVDRDLADQSDVLYGTVKDASTYHFFETATFDTYRKMYYFMQMHKDKVFVSSETEGVNKVRSSHGKYAFLIESPRNDYENARQPCDTMKVGNNLDVKGFGVATPIGSPLKNMKFGGTVYFGNPPNNAGELSRLQKKWWIDTSQCKSSKSQDTHSELALSNVAGVFYILGAGLLLAMAVALVEFCYNTHMEASNNKVPVSDVMKNKARMTIGAREFDNGRVSQMYYASGNTLNPLEDQVHSNTHTQV